MLEGLRTRIADMISPTKQLATQGEVAPFVAGAVTSRQTVRRGTAELMRAYRDLPWLRAVVHRIAESIASQQFTLFVQTNPRNGRAVLNRKLRRANFVKRRKMMNRLKSHGELREIEHHPMLDLLERGNSLLDGMAVQQLTQTYLDMKGEAFLMHTDNAQGMPIALWPLPPHWVSDLPRLDRQAFQLSVRGFRSNVPAEQMLFCKDPDPENPYGRGSGVAESLADELDSDEYASQFIKSFFSNGGIPDAVFSFDGASEEDVKAAEVAYANKYRGPTKAHRVAFFNQKVAVDKLTHEFKDLPLVELRKFFRDTVHQVFGVPPEILGIIVNSNRATIDAAGFLYALWVLMPRLERLRTCYQNQLAPLFDERLIVDFESPIPEDRAFKLEAMGKTPWNYTRAEIRDLGGEESHGEVDDAYIMPLNLFERPVSAEEPVAPPEEAPAPEPEDVDDAPEIVDDDKLIGRRRMLLLPTRHPKSNGHSKVFTQGEIPNLLEQLNPEKLTAPVMPIHSAELQKWGNQTMGALGVEPAFNMLNPLVVDHLESVAAVKLSEQVNETTIRAIQTSLSEGAAAGEGIAQIARRVETVFAAATGPRATMIARTEVLRSSNFATWTAQSFSGVVPQRQWIATGDDLTRDTHADELDTQIVGIANPFQIPSSGLTAMFPGDFGAPEEDINCRCTTIAVLEEGRAIDSAITKQTFREDLKRRQRWESKLRAALRKGFREQQKDVLEALGRVR
jgi:HK97 family phage portal protein